MNITSENDPFNPITRLKTHKKLFHSPVFSFWQNFIFRSLFLCGDFSVKLKKIETEVKDFKAIFCVVKSGLHEDFKAKLSKGEFFKIICLNCIQLKLHDCKKNRCVCEISIQTSIPFISQITRKSFNFNFSKTKHCKKRLIFHRQLSQL